MNKQLSVMGLAARASMVPVLIAAGLTALAVGALTYLANPEHTGGAAGVGAAPLAAAVLPEDPEESPAIPAVKLLISSLIFSFA